MQLKKKSLGVRLFFLIALIPIISQGLDAGRMVDE